MSTAVNCAKKEQVLSLLFMAWQSNLMHLKSTRIDKLYTKFVMDYLCFFLHTRSYFMHDIVHPYRKRFRNLLFIILSGSLRRVTQWHWPHEWCIWNFKDEVEFLKWDCVVKETVGKQVENDDTVEDKYWYIVYTVRLWNHPNAIPDTYLLDIHPPDNHPCQQPPRTTTP